LDLGLHRDIGWGNARIRKFGTDQKNGTQFDREVDLISLFGFGDFVAEIGREAKPILRASNRDVANSLLLTSLWD